MPALLLALGTVFQWLVQALLVGFASAMAQKAMRLAVAVFLLPLILGWLTQFIGGATPFDLGQLLSTFIGGLPATIAWFLDAFGFIGFVFAIVKLEVGAFLISLYMRIFGAGK
jgi:hypothetical protein